MPPLPSSSTVGLIGLGLMGRAFGERLLRGGFTVLGYDLDAGCRDAFSGLGGKSLASARDVVQHCERVILSLPSHREVGDVMTGANGALRRGQVILDTTTGDPE